MFDTALRKLSEVESYTCALESVEDVRKFMQIRFLGQFVRNELITQMEAEEIFHGLRRGSSRSTWMMCREGEKGRSIF